MKQIKTDWRSSLAKDTLDDLMIVLLLSPSIAKFDPTDAVNQWHDDTIRGRRPEFMEGDDSEDEEEEEKDELEDAGEDEDEDATRDI